MPRTRTRLFVLAALSVMLAPLTALAIQRTDLPETPGQPDQQNKPVQSSPSVDGSWQLLMPNNPVGPPPGPVRPDARSLHTAIYDPVNKRMVVSGGDGNGNVAFSDVWTLDLSTPDQNWSPLAVNGTLGPRRDHTAIYDPVRQRMVVFGGSLVFNSPFNDVHALSLGANPTWTTVATQGTPPSARFSHAAMYDPINDRMIVFGGYDGAFLNDVWALDFTTSPATWSPLAPAGGPPPVRDAMTTLYDPIGQRLLVFGGFGDGQFRGDLWALNMVGPPAWTQLSTAGGPSARRHYAAAIDAVHHKLILTGGLHFTFGSEVGDLLDTWELSLDTMAWTQVPTPANPAIARSGHRAVYQPDLDEFVFFGGYDDAQGSYRDDTWRLVRTPSPHWEQVIGTVVGGTVPTPRRDHTAVVDNDGNMLVFGGFENSAGFLNDTWKLDTGALAWTQIVAPGTPPSPRFAHAAMWDPVTHRMYVFGGYDGNNFINDLYMLDLSGVPVWSQVVPSGAPPVGRNAMTAIYDAPRRRLLIFGGWSGTEFLNDLWSLNLDGAPAWTQIVPDKKDAPVPRRHYAAIYDPSNDRLIISQGYNLTYLKDSWQFDLVRNKWSHLNGGHVPLARNSHRGVLDTARNRMIIFGGYGGTDATPGYLNDTWAYGIDAHANDVPGVHRGWDKLMPAGDPPSPRLLHTAIYDAAHDRMLVFGGETAGNFQLNDLWALAFTSPSPIAKSLAPESHSTVAAPAFAIHQTFPNPAKSAFRVDFSLPAEGAAALDLYSVNGRRVASRDVGQLGPGRHQVSFEQRLAPGVYWVRLTRAGSNLSSKVVVLP